MIFFIKKYLYKYIFLFLYYFLKLISPIINFRFLEIETRAIGHMSESIEIHILETKNKYNRVIKQYESTYWSMDVVPNKNQKNIYDVNTALIKSYKTNSGMYVDEMYKYNHPQFSEEMNEYKLKNRSYIKIIRDLFRNYFM